MIAGRSLLVGLAAAHRDLPMARHLARRLASARLQVRLICAGAPEGQDEEAGVSACDVTLVLWSPAAATSLFVRRAAAAAAARGRLVEVCLGGEAPLGERAIAPLPLPPRPGMADLARLAGRLRRAAEGRPQHSAVAALAGPAVLAALVAAAATAPFVWLATQEPTTAVAGAGDDILPRPSTGVAPADPEPQGRGMGGPLLERVMGEDPAGAAPQSEEPTSDKTEAP